VTALQAPASSELDVIGEGFTPPTLEKGAIDPDVLGPLEGRASGPSRRERWDASDVRWEVQVEAAAAIDDPNQRA
jgi:hypothetical protein